MPALKGARRSIHPGKEKADVVNGGDPLSEPLVTVDNQET